MKRIGIVAILAMVMAIFALVNSGSSQEAEAARPTPTASPSPTPTPTLPACQPGTGPVVLLLHGFDPWGDSVSNWNTAILLYEQQGYIVYALKLPYAGGAAGDTEKNATFVNDLISQCGLTDVKADGHSLGGWLVLDLILVHRNPAITSGVLRDTNVSTLKRDCMAVKDQCPDSALLKAINGAAPSSVPVLNLNHLTDPLPGETCHVVFAGMAHGDFTTDPTVNSMAIGWPEVNPCGSP